jgi:rubrerythrin
MGKAPNKCPMCKEVTNWKKVDTQKKGFSVGKAAVGGVLLGPIGLIGGALGKKKSAYYCGNCGFSHEYNG